MHLALFSKFARAARRVVGLAAVAGTTLLSCNGADEPERVEPDTPQTYGRCGESFMDCMPAPMTYGGCSEYYTELDLLTNMPIGPWWAVCEPACATDDDCPIPNSGSAEPRCDLDDGDGACKLECAADTDCPEGMQCPDARGVCMWPGAE